MWHFASLVSEVFIGFIIIRALERREKAVVLGSTVAMVETFHRHWGSPLAGGFLLGTSPI